MLSHTSDYALRAMLVLARRHGGCPVRVEEIASVTGAPRNYLGKTLHALTKAGLVTSARGPAGGFSLAVAPEALTLARVIDCFDEPHPSGHCLMGAGACNPGCGTYDSDGRLDFATTGYYTPGYFLCEDPRVLVYYNRFGAR